MNRLLVTSLFAANSVFYPVVLFLPVLAAKGLVPVRRFREACDRVLVGISFEWTKGNALIFEKVGGLRVETRFADGVTLDPSKRYLILPNHQSWVDIIVLQGVFHPKTPFLTFFLKSELRWVPVFGLIWWALGFPYMKRHSAAYLAKHPEKKGQDLETTKRFCERIRKNPFAVINFVEGTRRTKEKAKKSPFKHLLQPKAGGIATAISALDYEFDHVLDVTLVYDTERNSFDDLLAGRPIGVTVDVRDVPLQNVPRGDYFNDEAFAAEFRDWLNGLWADKDARFEEVAAREALDGAKPSPT